MKQAKVHKIVSDITLREERRLKVLENRALRRTFGFGATRYQRVDKINNDLFSSHNIVAVIKWRIMSWAEKVGRGEAAAGYLWGKLRERYNFWESGVNRMIKLRRIFRK